MGLNILHANANVLMANGLNAILTKGDGIDFIKNAADEQCLFASLEEDDYDLVVIDPLSSSERFTVATTLKLKERYPNKKVLIISEIHSPANEYIYTGWDYWYFC